MPLVSPFVPLANFSLHTERQKEIRDTNSHGGTTTKAAQVKVKKQYSRFSNKNMG